MQGVSYLCTPWVVGKNKWRKRKTTHHPQSHIPGLRSLKLGAETWHPGICRHRVSRWSRLYIFSAPKQNPFTRHVTLELIRLQAIQPPESIATTDYNEVTNLLSIAAGHTLINHIIVYSFRTSDKIIINNLTLSFLRAD